MTITPNLLTRWAGIAAAAAGAIFIGVQINHPQLNATSIQTTDVYIRDSLKVLMAALALVGITGMYLNQVRKHGLLGLIGYVVFAVGYLGIMCVTFAAAYVLPEVATSNPGFVNDAIAVNTGRGTVTVTSGVRARLKVLASPTWSAACSSASRCTGPVSCPAGPPPCSPSPARHRSPLADARRLLPPAGLPQRHRDDRPGLLAVEGRPRPTPRPSTKQSRSAQRSTAGVE